jgi:lipopolysaccharide biosynthesis glycosyltransferase
MAQQTNFIVFQCYGNEAIFHECAFALLSLTRLYGESMPGTEIWIYTDNAPWFSKFRGIGLPLNFRTVDGAQISKWRGKIDFVHRVKIEVLADFTRNRNGNVLYADTDVVFNQRLDDLFSSIGSGKQYMHVMEGVVSSRSNPIFSKLDTYLRDNTVMKVNGQNLWDLPMWNAGVLGFKSGNRDMLEDILTFTDTEYPKFPKHIIEQFACSVFFHNSGQIKTAAAWVLHYWNLKEARTTLASFFNHFSTRPWGELAQLASLIQMPVMMQEKGNFLQNRSIADKILKKQWHPTDYDWKELVRQL